MPIAIKVQSQIHWHTVACNELQDWTTGIKQCAPRRHAMLLHLLARPNPCQVSTLAALRVTKEVTVKVQQQSTWHHVACNASPGWTTGIMECASCMPCSCTCLHALIPVRPARLLLL